MKNLLILYLQSVLSVRLYESHEYSNVHPLSDNIDVFNVRFTRLKYLDNHVCNEYPLSQTVTSGLEECFMLCETTNNCKYTYWNTITFGCKTYHACSRVNTRNQVVNHIQSEIYYYSPYVSPAQEAAVENIVFIVHGNNQSIYWNHVESIVYAVNPNIIFLKTNFNASMMNELIISNCNLDKRIITTNPFIINSASYNVVNNAIQHCYSYSKRILVITTSTYENTAIPFVGVDAFMLANRCANAAFTTNETEIIEFTPNSYSNKTIFLYTGTLDIQNYHTTYIFDRISEKITNMGSIPVILPHGSNLSEYNTLYSSYISEKFLICIGVDACSELDSEGIQYDMNCGDDLKQVKYYGTSVESEVLSAIKLVRNFTLPGDETPNRMSVHIRVQINGIDETQGEIAALNSNNQITTILTDYVSNDIPATFGHGYTVWYMSMAGNAESEVFTLIFSPDSGVTQYQLTPPISFSNLGLVEHTFSNSRHGTSILWELYKSQKTLDTLHISTLSSNITRSVNDTYQSNNCSLIHSEFTSIGDYMFTSEENIKVIDFVDINRDMELDSINRIAVDYCVKNANCNGFSINLDHFSNIVSIQFAQHISDTFRTQSHLFNSCAYVKNTPILQSIACTHNMLEIENIKYLIDVSVVETQQCQNNPIIADTFISQYIQ